MIVCLLTAMAIATDTAKPPTPIAPVPSRSQLAWQQREMYAFVHFGPNTFSGKEWGEGTEDPNSFNPSQLDCRQWVRTFKAANLRGIIITAKHHDGFCLWPSKYSTHTVAQSKWKNGKGDVLKELAEACKAEGMAMGVYLSPWDRNHPQYGTDQYNQVFANMLREVLTNYGPIFEVWFDGANGEGPNGKKQQYDWPLFIRTVRECQPDAVIFSDAGPDVRWVGNEQGHASATNWNLIDRVKYFPGTPLFEELGKGDENGKDWVPAECDVSIRPGWFYRKEEDGRVKTMDELLDLYHASVGRGSNLLLNIPADRRGRIADIDAKTLVDFRESLREIYKDDLALGARVSADASRGAGFEAGRVVDGEFTTYWAASDDHKSGTLVLDLDKPTVFDRVLIQEPIWLGQRVRSFVVQVQENGSWRDIGRGTTVGYKKILEFPAVKAQKIRVLITSARACPAINRIGVFASPGADLDLLVDTKAQHDQRMEWFRNARFGMFIHWGLYSLPAGEWRGKNYPGASEWLIYHAKISPQDWEPLKNSFNPVNYDARKWVQIAKDAGMKYIVITSKHHEGFGMWPSKLNDWNIGSTAFKRDPLKELADACQEAGIKLCFYHSILDWHHPDYSPRRSEDTRKLPATNMDRYDEFMKAQLKELLTNYGKIGILWFDGEWDRDWTHERGKHLYHYIRGLQPEIIVNNRVDRGRSGMGGMTAGKRFQGDYGTPEQQIPTNGLPGTDWESCMTMNDSWGFHKSDRNWKSAAQLVRNLADCASKGGNYLLNIGPTSLGEIPPESVDRLKAVGDWMEVNGSAIYGSSAGPFPQPLRWGRVTHKGAKLYLIVFSAPTGKIELPGLKTKILSVHSVDGRPIPVLQDSESAIVDLTGETLGEMPSVYVAAVPSDAHLTVVKSLQKQRQDGSITLAAVDAKVDGATAQYESDKDCIGFWTNSADSVAWEFNVDRPGEYRVQIELACPQDTEGTTFDVVAGDNALRARVPSTPSWSSFSTIDLGKISLSEGKVRLRIKPIHMPGYAVMNLRAVNLIP
jgi:alpha-L-fucosidase